MIEGRETKEKKKFGVLLHWCVLGCVVFAYGDV